MQNTISLMLLLSSMKVVAQLIALTSQPDNLMLNTDDSILKMTKTRRKQLARELIGSYEIGKCFAESDCKRLSEICGYEFEWVKRATPKQGKAMSVYVSWPAGEYIGSWGWLKSINGYDERNNLLEAMRTASRSGTFSGVKRDVCVQCGNTARLTIDHKTTPFTKIVEQFFDEHGKPDIENIDFGWQLVDLEPFIGFHDQLADYQVLCISCNAKKGAAIA